MLSIGWFFGLYHASLGPLGAQKRGVRVGGWGGVREGKYNSYVVIPSSDGTQCEILENTVFLYKYC